MCGRILSLQVFLISIVFASSFFEKADAATKTSSVKTATATNSPAPSIVANSLMDDITAKGTKIGEDCKKKTSGGGGGYGSPGVACTACTNAACAAKPDPGYRVGSWEWNACCDAADKVCHPPSPTPKPSPKPTSGY